MMKKNIKESYETSLITEVISPDRESEIKDIFGRLGKIERIKEEKIKKTNDYIIRDRRFFIEVTSLNLIHPYSLKRSLSKRINRRIKHISGKNISKFPYFKRIGVIYYDILIAIFLMKKLKSIKEEIKNLCKKSNIDCLIFICDKASINNKSSREVYPLEIITDNEFLKNEIKNLFISK